MTRIEQIETECARYAVHVHEVDGRQPFTIYLHGGPGFNASAERQVLGPLLAPSLNLLWFDLLGCAGSPARSPDRITWDNTVTDVVRLVRRFTTGPVNVVGHCLAAQMTHDLVRQHPAAVRRVVWYSPAHTVTGVFKGILVRSVLEGRLRGLTPAEGQALARFCASPDEAFGRSEVDLILSFVGRIEGLQEMYWSDLDAMRRYLSILEESPIDFDVFRRLQTDFFERGPLPVPDYGDIPVLALHADDDRVAPWEIQGAPLLRKIRNAADRRVEGGCHWLHLQRPDVCARHTIEFLTSP